MSAFLFWLFSLACGIYCFMYMRTRHHKLYDVDSEYNKQYPYIELVARFLVLLWFWIGINSHVIALIGIWVLYLVDYYFGDGEDSSVMPTPGEIEWKL